MTGIYCFKNLINGKVYIGQAVDIEKRYKQHLRNIDNDEHQESIYLALRKYGLENFSFEVLEECDAEKLSALEVYYIDKYDAYCSGGYNETKGGEGSVGYKHTMESKEKMSKSRKGRIIDDVWRQHIKEGSSHHMAWNNGKNLSKEHKEKISNGLKGHKHTEESKKKMSKNSTNKKAVLCDGIEFASITDCANFYHVNHSTMKDWLDGKVCVPKEFYDKGLTYKNLNCCYMEIPYRYVVCDNIEYNNITKCSLSIGIERSTLSKWLNGTNNMPDEFIDRGLKFIECTHHKIIKNN